LDSLSADGTRKRTVHGYRALVRRWIHLDQRKKGSRTGAKGQAAKGCPNLGFLAISKVTADDVRKLYTYMRQVRQLSARQVRQLHAALNPAMRRAEQEGLIGRNPCASVKLPKVEREDVSVMDAEQVAAFMPAAKSDRLFALWALLLGTGLRPSEALALSWSDIRDGHVHVERALVASTTEGAAHFSPPKTKAGRRMIPVPASVDVALRHHRVRQAEEKLAAGPRYTDTGLVFASTTGTMLQYSNVVRRHFVPVLTAAGLVDAEGKPLFTPYSLRHTFGTRMIFEGQVPVKTVSIWLGHSSVSFTLDTYVHVGGAQLNEAATVADRVMFGT
jgi:integrase